MKRAITALLFLFVGVNVVMLVVKESRSTSSEPGPVAATRGEDAVTAAATSPSPQRTASDRSAAPSVLMYYFHGAMRCPTCLKMERYAREAIEDEFPVREGAGRVQWLAVNYDEPAHEHFVAKYQLVASTIVIAARGANNEESWRKLDRTWDLVGDEPAFKRYVVEEVTSLLGDAP